MSKSCVMTQKTREDEFLSEIFNVCILCGDKIEDREWSKFDPSRHIGICRDCDDPCWEHDVGNVD